MHGTGREDREASPAGVPDEPPLTGESRPVRIHMPSTAGSNQVDSAGAGPAASDQDGAGANFASGGPGPANSRPRRQRCAPRSWPGGGR